MQPIDRVLETILYVDDLDAAERFYGEVLGLELDSRKDGLFVFFRCGAGMLLLFEPEAATTGRNVPAHGARGPGHACFAVAEDALPAWQARLAAAGVSVEQEMMKVAETAMDYQLITSLYRKQVGLIKAVIGRQQS